MIRTGDRVMIRVGGGDERALEGHVLIASENGRSLMLAFDGALRIPGSGSYLGEVALLMGDDGEYHDLFSGEVVTVEGIP